MTRFMLTLVAAGLCAFLSAPGFAQDTATLDAQVKAHLKAIGDDVDAIKAIRAAMAARLPKPGSEPAPLTFSLHLPQFFVWHDRWGSAMKGDLKLTLYHHKGVTTALPAEHPEAEGMPCYLDAANLKVLPSTLEGSVRLRIGDIWSRDLTVGIKAALSGQNVSGVYTKDAGSREEPLTGKVTPATPRVVPPPARPDADGTGGLADEQYDTAKSMEGAAMGLYDDVRAIVLAQGGRISYAHATALTASQRFTYPPLPRLTASGRVEKKRSVSAPDLDDIMADRASELDAAATTTAPAGASPVVVSALVKELGNIRTRVSTRRRILEGLQGSAAADPTPVIGTANTTDPAFGPWYGGPTLPSDKTGANRIPADAGSAGAQAWMQIGNWLAFGPCDPQRRGFETPTMPDLVPGSGMVLPWNSRFKHARLPAEGLKVTVQPASVEAGSGLCRLAMCATYEDHGPQRIYFPFATTYAWTEVHADADTDLWLGATVNDHGQLWVNDRLVWTSTPDRPVRHMEEAGVFRVRFTKGANRLYMRLDNLKDDGYFAVRVCVRGGPRPPEEVASARAAQEKAGSPAEGVWGWRHDFAGRHGENVTAPIAWDPHEKKNVKWINPMGFCYASPLVVGNRLITFEEPHTVICVDKMTGAELWRRDCDMVMLADAAVQAEAKPVRETAEAARQELAKLGPDWHTRTNAFAKGGLDPTAADARVRDLQKAAGSYVEYLSRKGIVPHMGWYNDVGHTYPTPVTDGKHVFVKINTGALACLDLDGNVQWMINHGVATGDCGAACPSPLLVGGKLIVFGPEEGKKTARQSKPATEEKEDDEVPPPVVPEILVTGGYVLKAFDPASGRLAWRVETPVGGQICGTPTALRLSNGKDTMDVIVTANGTVVRADDGKVICAYVGTRECYGSPTSEGNRFTISENRAKSLFELTLLDRETVGVRRRWYVDHVGHFQDGNFGAFHKGKLYFSRPLIDVTDVATGNLDWLSDNIFFCRPGRGYAPIALAGGRIYCADNATWFQPTYRPGLRPYPGAMPVLELGDPPLTLACNPIDRLSGGFTFDGDRLYIRGNKSLMCIGYTGDEGRAWEADRIATKLFRSNLYDPPDSAPALVVKAGVNTAGKKPLAAMDAVGTGMSWLFATVPAATADAVGTALSGTSFDGWFEGGKNEVEAGGQTVGLKRLHEGNMPHWAAEDPFKLYGRKNRDGGDLFWRGPHIGYSEMLGRQVEISRLAKPESGKTAILATLLVNDVPRTARFDAGHAQAVKAWIGGAEVRHNQYVELPAGTVPLIVAIRMDDPGEPLLVQPRLWPSGGVESDRKRWTSLFGRTRPHFENAAKLSPRTLAGQRAATLLAAAR
jgi:hypothetical protein